MAEQNISEISRHLLLVYLSLRQQRDWLTNRQIAERTQEISERTVRAHTMKLAKLGLVEQCEVFGGYLYRIRTELDAPARQLRARLERTATVMGVAAAAPTTPVSSPRANRIG